MKEVKKSYNLTVTDTEKSMILRGLLLLENEARKIYDTSFGIMAEDLKREGEQIANQVLKKETEPELPF